MTINLKSKKAVIWDFDGVFYDADDAVADIHFEANARVASRLFAHLDFDDVKQMSREFFFEYHDGMTGFIKYGVEQGYNETYVRDFIDYYHNELAFKLLNERRPELFVAQPKLREAFAQNASVQQGILTHARVNTFTAPILRSMTIRDAFSASHLMGMSDYDFKPKGQSTIGLDMMMLRMGVEAKDTVFVEDTLKNLEIAKNQHPNLTTVLKTNTACADQFDYVDDVISSPLELLQKMAP